MKAGRSQGGAVAFGQFLGSLFWSCNVLQLALLWLSAKWDSPCSLSFFLWGRVTIYLFLI